MAAATKRAYFDRHNTALSMLLAKFSSHKSLFFVFLLSLSVGVLNTACRSADPISSSAVITPTTAATTTPPSTDAIANSETTTKAETSDLAVDSEIDPGDAYIEDDPSPPPLPVDDFEPNDEQIRALQQRTDANGNLLPELIDGLAVGMPYREARQLIIGDIWTPRTHPPIDTTYDAPARDMQALGFEEVRSCAGTGLGLCRMEFVERDGGLLGIIVSPSGDEPSVWTWDIN